MSGTSFSAMIGTKVWKSRPSQAHLFSLRFRFLHRRCWSRCNFATNQSALTYDYAYYAWSNLLTTPKKVILPISGFPHRCTTGTTALDLQLCRHHTLTASHKRDRPAWTTRRETVPSTAPRHQRHCRAVPHAGSADWSQVYRFFPIYKVVPSTCVGSTPTLTSSISLP